MPAKATWGLGHMNDDDRVCYKQFTLFALLILTLVSLLIPGPAAALDEGFFEDATLSELPGLQGGVQVMRDQIGIPHIRASNVDDLFFMQGWVHAQDRLFQMDATRRQASGTQAELLGPDALAGDVELRNLGMRRAAEKSLAVLSPRTRRFIDAYVRGVNTYIAGHPLPADYAELEITRIPPWTALDTVAVAKLVTLSLSFDQFDLTYTRALQAYTEWGANGGFDGEALFFEDLYRTQPFEPAATVPDAEGIPTPLSAAAREQGPAADKETNGIKTSPLSDASADMVERYLKRVQSLPFLKELSNPDRPRGSNEWSISGANTTTGAPMVANDPHLPLTLPTIFYPNRLKAGPVDVIGSSFAGAPFIIVGRNAHMAWGATIHFMDATDFYTEKVVLDPANPGQFFTVHNGQNEPVTVISQTFRYNVVGNGVPDDLVTAQSTDELFIPPLTLIMPRRNNGPIIEVDVGKLIATGESEAISVQYTGFGPTRELDTFRIFDEARTLAEFTSGLRFFDVGSINWAYADQEGNIAYFVSGELPVREDLQAGAVNGRPPSVIRSGEGGNEWLPVQNPQPNQATPYEIVPFDEMPKLINPPAGWFVNSNNDPAGVNLDNNPFNQFRPGGGIFYLSSYYNIGIRGARATALVTEKLSTGDGKMSFEEMQEIQADVLMPDARVFLPYILQAYLNATAAGADPALAALVSQNPRLSEALWRMLNWDFTTPSGMPRGYDASDVDGVPGALQPGEINRSVATTLYSAWRSQVLANTLDVTLNRIGQDNGVAAEDVPRPPSNRSVLALRYLLDNFDTNQGVGVSGVDFFQVDGVAEAADRRDIIVLQSLLDGLDLLSGEAFKPIYNGSTDMGTYRWGRLHRLILEHPLGGAYDAPPAGGAFPPVVAGLEGIPVDGGFDTLDQAAHDARGYDRELEPELISTEGFTYSFGPVNRFVADMSEYGSRTESVWPGGTSGVLGDPNYANQLPFYLTNDTYPLTMLYDDTRPDAQSVDWYLPEGTLAPTAGTP